MFSYSMRSCIRFSILLILWLFKSSFAIAAYSSRDFPPHLIFHATEFVLFHDEQPQASHTQASGDDQQWHDHREHVCLEAVDQQNIPHDEAGHGDDVTG